MLLKILAVILMSLGAFASRDCQDLVPSEVVIEKYRPSFSHSMFFMNSWWNSLQLWLNRENLMELPGVAVREQCYGTCFLYADQNVLESHLKSKNVIAEDDYLVNAVSTLQIAWERYQKNPKKFHNADLENILDGGDFEPFMLAEKSPLFVLDSANLAALGGTEVVAEIETRLIEALNRNGSLRSFLSLGFNAFTQKIKNLLEEKLSKKAKRQIGLKSVKVRNIELELFQVKRGEGYYSSPNMAEIFRLVGPALSFNADSLATLLKAFPESNASGILMLKEESFDVIFEAILYSLSQGRAVDASVMDLFGGELGSSIHAISIVGAIVDKESQVLRGFKFVNSWGDDNLAEGFGFLSVDVFREKVKSVALIKSLAIDPEK